MNIWFSICSILISVCVPRIEYREKFVTIIVIGYNARKCTHRTIITNRRPDYIMVRKDESTFHTSRRMTATTFLLIAIITTGTLFAFPLVLNQSHTAMSQQQQLSGNSFQIDNMTFSHHTTSVNGIQLHYVIGGHGDPIVLLHGWPETWYAWHKVMPVLAKNYTVVAPDLRGLGDSSKPPTGYDGKTLAEDIHQPVTKLGFKTIFLVGGDIGVFVAYPYAAAHPTEVKKLAVWEAPIPGFAIPGRPHYGGSYSIKHLMCQKPL
jgi:alpha/beta hydrolase fold